jgi:putative transposase
LKAGSPKLSYLEFVDNHIHLIVKTREGGATISRIMQYIKSRIAEVFNRLNSCTGSFWNERYKSEIIENSRYPIETFCRLIWYLSYHSVRRGEDIDPRKNPYSSIHGYLNKNYNSEIPLSRHEYFNFLGESFDEQVRSFKKYEEVIKNIQGAICLF